MCSDCVHNLHHTTGAFTCRGGHEPRKAPLVLARLESAMEQAEFIGFIQAYFNSADKTTPALLKVLDDVAGSEKVALFESMLAE